MATASVLPAKDILTTDSAKVRKIQKFWTDLKNLANFALYNGMMEFIAYGY